MSAPYCPTPAHLVFPACFLQPPACLIIPHYVPASHSISELPSESKILAHPQVLLCSKKMLTLPMREHTFDGTERHSQQSMWLDTVRKEKLLKQ